MKKRPIIGFIVPNMLGDYFGLQWYSVHHSAVKYNVDLVIFTPFMFLTGRKNFIENLEMFKYISRRNIDGIIVSSASLQNYYKDEEIDSLFSILGDNQSLPLVCQGSRRPGVPSVLIDGKIGMKKLVSHFIQDHEFRDIAFIRGPETNKDSNDRFEAYNEAMEEAGIPLNEQFLLSGDFGYNSGRLAVMELLDRRKVKPRAIISVNDDMILGAYNELTARGIAVPGEIALGGFDDIKAIQNTTVPISSVRQPFDEQVNTAVVTLLRMIDGKNVEQEIHLSARPVLRGSCGCYGNGSYNNMFAAVDDKYAKFQADYEKYKSTQEGFDIGFISEFSNSIMNVLDLNVLREECSRLFKKARIQTGLLALYNREAEPVFREENRIPFESSEAFMFYQENAESRTFEYETSRLFKEDFYDPEKRKTIFFSELTFQREHYGYMVLAMKDIIPLFINLFKLQLCNCLHNIFTYTTIDRTNKALEKARHKAEEASRLKSRFLANVSHEIRTPMNAILGFIDILKSQEEDSEKLEYMNIISDSGYNLLGLLNDVLDLSKIEADHLELVLRPFNIDALLDRVRKMFSIQVEEKKLELKFIIKEGIPASLTGDEMRINQIITNLVSNAIKFTHKGGIEVRASYVSGELVIEVQDTGIGIPKDKQEYIFEPFRQHNRVVQIKYGGTGLGLSICRKLTAMMDGSFNMSSARGEGSVFTFSLPLSPSDDTVLVSGIKEPEKNRKKRNAVVLTDHERLVLLGIAEKLKKQARIFNRKKADALVELLVPFLKINILKDFYRDLKKAVAAFNSLELERVGNDIKEIAGDE